MTDSNLFSGGMPTGPDVKRLNEEWPDPKPGDEFPYTRVARIIGVDADSNRFRSVTKAWRRNLQENKGIILGCVAARAFRVLTDNQVVSGTYDDVTGIQRKLRRRRKKLTAISPDDKITLAARDHAALLCFQLEKSAKQTNKILASPKVVSLPSINPTTVGSVDEPKDAAAEKTAV